MQNWTHSLPGHSGIAGTEDLKAEELAPTLASCSTQENTGTWLGSIEELTLLAGVMVTQPEGVSMGLQHSGEQDLPLGWSA